MAVATSVGKDAELLCTLIAASTKRSDAILSKRPAPAGPHGVPVQ